ncbi:MAG: hypothetical protein U5L96_22065 [Owenweeksia sp.]|nr:hypothetical protein [Owenweeksia sp.]
MVLKLNNCEIFLRIILGLLCFLVLLYLAVIFIGTPVMKSAIEKRLAYYPEDSLNIGLLELQLFPLGLQANNISFRLHQPGDSLIQRYSGEFEEIEVVGINWWRALRHNTWEVVRTEIDEGRLDWTVTNIQSPDTTWQKQKPASKKAKLLIENIDISQLNLELHRDSVRVNLQVSAMVDSLKFNPLDSLPWDTAGGHAFHRCLLELGAIMTWPIIRSNLIPAVKISALKTYG